MATAHSTLTGSDLHEPKGAAAANADEIYIANGSGSGSWTAADNNIYLILELDDISTASSTWLPSPCTGTVSSIQTIIHGAITSADAIVTAEINGTLITDSSITVAQSSSAAGDVDSSTPSAANTLAIGNKIEIITNGGSTNAVRMTAVLTVTPT
jgi:hypothetical protein